MGLLHAKIQEIAGNAMKVRDSKNVRNSAPTKCVDFTCFRSSDLKVLFMKSNTPLDITELYE